MTDLFTKVNIHLKQQLPFVLFCKPDSEKVVGLFQKNDHLYFLENFKENGFVFVPFEANTYPYIPLEYSEVIVDTIKNKTFILDNNPQNSNPNFGKDFFEELVSKAIEAIHENQFKKVVLSRREEVQLNDSSIELLFKKIVFCYPTAFRYCFYHPKIGLWLGASPEQLLQSEGNSIKTISLAGTRVVERNTIVEWSQKEITEQQLVTDFIVDSLDNLVKEITISSPTSVKAGSLWHIKTQIEAKVNSHKSIGKIIKALHPTPAVCGLPKAAAKNFILKNEGYNREYYSGFLGELNIDLATFKTQKTDLFVNLRCMKIVGDKAKVYVGCGITSESNPEDEFLETVNKSMTMKKCIM